MHERPRERVVYHGGVAVVLEHRVCEIDPCGGHVGHVCRGDGALPDDRDDVSTAAVSDVGERICIPWSLSMVILAASSRRSREINGLPWEAQK